MTHRVTDVERPDLCPVQSLHVSRRIAHMPKIPCKSPHICTFGDIKPHSEERRLPGQHLHRTDVDQTRLEVYVRRPAASHQVASLSVDMDCAVYGRNLILTAGKTSESGDYNRFRRNRRGLHDLSLRIKSICHSSEFNYGLIGLVQTHEGGNQMRIASAKDNHQAVGELVKRSAVACLPVDGAFYPSEAVERGYPLAFVHKNDRIPAHFHCLMLSSRASILAASRSVVSATKLSLGVFFVFSTLAMRA